LYKKDREDIRNGYFISSRHFAFVRSDHYNTIFFLILTAYRQVLQQCADAQNLPITSK